jgi:uncharacterized protein
LTNISAPALRRLLSEVRTVAIVGLSSSPSRPSNEVAAFLVRRGYTCVGVNPGIAGSPIHGMPVVAHLSDIDHAIDMIDVFRASEAVGGVVDEVLALDPLPRVLWMQLGVIDHVAAARAERAGLTVVMNQCPKIVLATETP